MPEVLQMDAFTALSTQLAALTRKMQSQKFSPKKGHNFDKSCGVNSVVMLILQISSLLNKNQSTIMKTLTRIKIIQFSMLTTLVRGIIQILGEAVTNLQGQYLKQYLDSKSMHKVYYSNMLSKYYQWKKCSCSLCKVNNNICKLNRNICILNSSSCKVNKLL